MKVVKLKDICTKGSSSLKQKDVQNGNGQYPVYGAGGIAGYIDSYHQEKEYIGIVKDGSGIGRVMFLPPKSSVIGTLQYILPKPGYDINYIGYCLKSLDLASHKQGAAIPHIYFKDYGEKLVNVEESLDEQRKIVAKLNATFERIDKMQSNAEQAYEEARKLLNSALESIFTPQDNWHKKEIQDIVDQGTSISYGIVQPGDDVQDGTPVIRPVDLGPEELSLSDSFKRTTNTISNGYKRTILNGKEILMCVRGTTGIVSLSNQTLIGCNVTRGIVPFKISSDTIRKYIYYWLQSPIAIDYIQKKTKGAALKQINIADVKKIPVYIPTNNQEIISITNKIQFITSRVIQLKHNMINMMDKHILLKQAILKETFE